MKEIRPKAQMLIDFVSNIIDPVYLVGGCVRDMCLDKEPKDYDFCTPFTPDEIEERIRTKGRKPINIGKKFGTLGVHYEGDTIEITSFRKEAYKPGNRKPEVEFISNIHEDLSRRDFTINSMAWRNEKILDPFGGQEDLKAGIIKATGNPTERFKEDPLRMLRACRFASQLGFKLEEQTYKKLSEHSHMIMGVSKERWTMELDKLLMGDHVENGLVYLYDSHLIKYMIPEMGLQHGYDQQSKFHDKQLDDHTAQVVANVPKDINLRWAAFLHDVGKPFIAREKKLGGLGYAKHEILGAEIVEHIGLYLKWPNQRIEIVSKLVEKHMEKDSPLREADNKSHVKEVKENINDENDLYYQGKKVEMTEGMIEEIEEEIKNE